MPSTVLVPVSLPDPEPIPESLVRLLSQTNVLVLGINKVPDQTVPDQARENDHGESKERINNIASKFRESGSNVTSKVIFTHNRRDTIDRVTKEGECNVILVPNHAGRMEWILVPLRGNTNIDRISDFVADLTTDELRRVTLLHVTDSESDQEGKPLLTEARQKLVDKGVDEQFIETDLITSHEVVETITEQAKNYDTIVIGGTEPSLLDRVFGDIPHRISQETGCPVFIIPPETKS